jgi:hypothetical protein
LSASSCGNGSTHSANVTRNRVRLLALDICQTWCGHAQAGYGPPGKLDVRARVFAGTQLGKGSVALGSARSATDSKRDLEALSMMPVRVGASCRPGSSRSASIDGAAAGGANHGRVVISGQTGCHRCCAVVRLWV